MTSFFPSQSAEANIPSYPTQASLPVSANQGDLATVLDTDSLYLWDGGWVKIASSSTFPLSFQKVYDDALNPLVIEDNTRGPVIFRQGGLQTGNLLEFENNSLTQVASIGVDGTLKINTGTGVLKSSSGGVVSSSQIVNADISTSAAIALSKLATGALPSGITIDSSNITNGSIVDADVSASAAIGLSKLATGALPSGITVSSTNIIDGTIVNADISASAAIAGTKINPDFGSQNVTTTGVVSGFSFSGNGVITTLSGVQVSPNSGIDTTSAGTLQIGTVNASTINIGTGAGATAINLGGTGDTVTIAGTLTTVNTTNLDVADKLITVNKGGGAASAGTAGIEVEESGSPTGYVRTSASRAAWQLKSPVTGTVTLQGGANSVNTTFVSLATVDRTHSFPDASGTVIQSTDTGTVTNGMLATDSVSTIKIQDSAITSAKIADGTIMNGDISPTAAIDGSKIVAASASVSGVVTTGAQTLAGDKSFSGITTISNTTAPTAADPQSGALVVAGGIGIGGDRSIVARGSIELGQGRLADGAVYIDLKSTAAASDFDARIIRNSTANGSLEIYSSGTNGIVLRNTTNTATGLGVLVQGVRGTNATTAAAGGSGYVGETIKTYRTGGNISLTAGVYATVISYALPSSGVWSLSGQLAFENSSGGSQAMTAVLVISGEPENESMIILDVPTGGSSAPRMVALPSRVISTTGTPTLLLNCRASSSASTLTSGLNNYSWISVTKVA